MVISEPISCLTMELSITTGSSLLQMDLKVGGGALTECFGVQVQKGRRGHVGMWERVGYE